VGVANVVAERSRRRCGVLLRPFREPAAERVAETRCVAAEDAALRALRVEGAVSDGGLGDHERPIVRAGPARRAGEPGQRDRDVDHATSARRYEERDWISAGGA